MMRSMISLVSAWIDCTGVGRAASRLPDPPFSFAAWRHRPALDPGCEALHDPDDESG